MSQSLLNHFNTAGSYIEILENEIEYRNSVNNAYMNNNALIHHHYAVNTVNTVNTDPNVESEQYILDYLITQQYQINYPYASGSKKK